MTFNYTVPIPSGINTVMQESNDDDFTAIPNPFNPVTTISIPSSLSSEGNVILELFDLNGRLYKTIYTGNLEQIVVNANGMNSGLYIARLRSGEEVLNKTLYLLK